MIKNYVFECVFNINPYPKRTATFSFRGGFARAVKNKKTKEFESTINLMARELWKNAPIDVPISVEIIFFSERPRSVKKRSLPHVKPDLSNLIKALEDGCNGVIWKDDALICELTARKEYSSGSGFIVMKIYTLSD